MFHIVFHRIFLAVLCCVSLLAPLHASAQTYPTKPVRLIVPFSAGSGTDILARIIGQKLSERLGQPVIVDNRPGAFGTLGTSLAAKAAPDGYTISIGASGTFGSTVSLFTKMPYDPVKDFAPISRIGETCFALIAGKDLPENSLQELMASVKANPGKRTLGAANGGARLLGELLRMTAAADMTIISYSSLSPAIVDLISGRLDTMLETLTSPLPYIKAGQIKALAVTCAKPSALLPKTPTIAASGYPEFDVTSWYALFAPAGTSREIVAKLNAAIVSVLQMPEVREKLMDNGIEALASTPEQLGESVRVEIAKWRRVVNEANVQKLD